MKRRVLTHTLLALSLASCMAVAAVSTALGEGTAGGTPTNTTDDIIRNFTTDGGYGGSPNYAENNGGNADNGAVGPDNGGTNNPENITIDPDSLTLGSSDGPGNSTWIPNSTVGSNTITVEGYSSNLTYTGSALTFDNLTVNYGGWPLDDGDYKIEYENNVNVGKASFTITYYEQSETFYFNIKPASLAKATVNGIRSKTYTGKALTQKPTVVVAGRTLKSGTDYTLSYSNNTKVGTAKVTITGKGNYAGSLTKKFTITKAANTLKVKGKTATVKRAKVAKKNQVLKRSKVLRVSKAKGKVTYAKKRGNKKITVNKKTGKVTVKKGLAKGTYKVKVKVTAAGNANYKKASKTVTFKVIVK